MAAASSARRVSRTGRSAKGRKALSSAFGGRGFFWRGQVLKALAFNASGMRFAHVGCCSKRGVLWMVRSPFGLWPLQSATPPFAARLIPGGHATAAPLRGGVCRARSLRGGLKCLAMVAMMGACLLLKKGRVARACVRRPCGLCPEPSNTPLCRAAYPRGLAKASPLRGEEPSLERIAL